MNNQKTLIIAFLLSFGLSFTVLSTVNGEGMGGNWTDGWNITEVVAASATVTEGPARVLKLWLSSGVANTSPSDYALLVDSACLVTPNMSHLNFARDQVKSPALLFSSSSVSGTNYPVIDYSPYGVFMSTAVTVWKSAVQSGNANRVYIMWRR